MVSVYQTIDTSHEDLIHDAQLNYYGTVLATCSSDEVIKLFDVTNKKQVLIAELRGHRGPVWGLSWSHPMHGNLLASCSYDKTVIIWGQQEGKWRKVYEYAGHESSVNSVCWAPHEYGLILASGSSDGSISILTCTATGNWEAKKIPDAHTVGVNAVSWAPAINANFMLNPSLNQTVNSLVKRLASGGCDCLVKIWREDHDSGRNWTEEARLEGHTDWVRDVAWSPSLSLSRQLIASCGQDCRVIIWQSQRGASGQTASEQLGDTAEPAVWKLLPLQTYSDVVWHVSWSLTGNILAVSGGDNKVTLWKENLEGNWISLSEITRGRQPANAYVNDAGAMNGAFTRDSLAPAVCNTNSNYFEPVAP
ncbi:hypothetical protein AAHC03_09647 [Spirometra sp. Aus1]